MNILLIHGSSHGAWCWDEMTGPLEAFGHQVKAIDLPGNGQDRTPHDQVSLEMCGSAICEAAQVMGGNVLLVGHSLGGVSISVAASLRPDLFAGLIYLTAYVPREGMTVLDIRDLIPDHPLTPAIERSADGLSVRFRDGMLEELFYHDCSAAQIDRARAHLCDQPVRPQREPVHLSDGFAALRKDYILCSEDRAIPPVLQRMMCDGWPVAQIHEIASGHSPFLSHPDQLAGMIDQIAKS